MNEECVDRITELQDVEQVFPCCIVIKRLENRPITP